MIDSVEGMEFVSELLEKLERIAMALENLSTGLDEIENHFGIEPMPNSLQGKVTE